MKVWKFVKSKKQKNSADPKKGECGEWCLTPDAYGYAKQILPKGSTKATTEVLIYDVFFVLKLLQGSIVDSNFNF